MDGRRRPRLTLSEELFVRFCVENAIPYLRIPESDVRTPDFTIQLGSTSVVCEVKQIDPNDDDAMELTELTVGAVSEARCIRNRLRRVLKGISGQLRAASRNGRPALLVVYDNTPFCQYLDDDDVLEALFGELTLKVFVNHETGESWAADPFFGRNRGVGEAYNTSMSALAVLEETHDRTLQLRVYHNPHASATLEPALLAPLPCIQRVLPDGSYGAAG